MLRRRGVAVLVRLLANGCLAVFLCLICNARPAPAQELGLTISVSGPPKKITFTTGPAGIERGRVVVVPKDAIVRIENKSGSADLQVRVRFRGKLVHEETVNPTNRTDLVVGSQMLPDGAHYSVSDPPFVLVVEDRAVTASGEAAFELILPSLAVVPTLTSYGLLFLALSLAVLGWFASRKLAGVRASTRE